MDADTLLYLSSEDVVAAAREVDPIACVHEALTLHARGRTLLPAEAHLNWTSPSGGRARSLSMPGMLPADMRVIGTKIINSNPDNVTRGLPRASGVTVLFDPETAQPLCVMEASYISNLRTAAVSVLAASVLARPGSVVAGVIGAGAIARAHVELLVGRFPGMRQVLVFDRAPERADMMVAALAEPLADRRVVIGRSDSVEEVTRSADVLVTATTTTTSYVALKMLREGAVALNVSLDDLDVDVLLGADALYVDDWDLIVQDEHRLLGQLARKGLVHGPRQPHDGAQRSVTGTLGDLLLGQCPGRASESDVIVVNPFGMSISDLAVAHAVLSVAEMRGLGVRLPR